MKDEGFWVGLVLIVGLSIGIAAGYCGTKRMYHKQAIERGYAEYNKTTGCWQWIEPAPEEQEVQP